MNNANRLAFAFIVHLCLALSLVEWWFNLNWMAIMTALTGIIFLMIDGGYVATLNATKSNKDHREEDD